MSERKLGVADENGVREDRHDGSADRIAALGRAISDPKRVRMLSMMAEVARSGRGCCDFSGSGVPAEEGEEGICVCEFEDQFGMGQSKVSYHMRKLKEAGLVREEKRGRWTYYSLDRGAAAGLLGEAEDRLLSGSERQDVGSGC